MIGNLGASRGELQLSEEARIPIAKALVIIWELQESSVREGFWSGFFQERLRPISRGANDRTLLIPLAFVVTL